MNLKSKNFKVFVFCLFLFLVVIQFVPSCSAVLSDDAADAISQAEHDLGSAFSAVSVAESAGANVSVLLTRLNVAGDLLSDAFVAFESGDYENARRLAVESSQGLEGIVVDADRLRVGAGSVNVNDRLLTFFISSIGLVLVVVLGLLGWKFLKKWYFRRIFSSKPVVEESS